MRENHNNKGETDLKIKGIDLYKRMVENDSTLINKKFYNDNFGEYKIQIGGQSKMFMCMFDDMGMNLLNDKKPLQINDIFTSEWEEVKEPVTWQEAIEARMNGKDVYFIYEEDKHEVYGDVLGIYSVNDEILDDDYIDFDMLQNGEWFIED